VASKKNPAAVALGKRRAELMTAEEHTALGIKAAAARADSLTPAQRSAIAKKAAAARWGLKKAAK
jgi:hypothetical protein